MDNQRGLKVTLLESFVYFDSALLAIGWRGHVTLHMRESKVQNQKQLYERRDKYRIV